MYTYLVFDKMGNSCFYTNYYDYENNYIEGSVVFNLLQNTFTTDGITWEEIEEDHL